MEHTNKIAIKVLKDNYSDYPRNAWHYDREYRMLVKAIEMSESMNNKVAVDEYSDDEKLCMRNSNFKCNCADTSRCPNFTL